MVIPTPFNAELVDGSRRPPTPCAASAYADADEKPKPSIVQSAALPTASVAMSDGKKSDSRPGFTTDAATYAAVVLHAATLCRQDAAVHPVALLAENWKLEETDEACEAPQSHVQKLWPAGKLNTKPV